jgi:hypothetical protein
MLGCRCALSCCSSVLPALFLAVHRSCLHSINARFLPVLPPPLPPSPVPLYCIGYAHCVKSYLHHFLSMATPYTHSGATLSTEPSRTLLQKLLEEINGTPTPTVLRSRTSSIVSPTRPVWAGGASIAEDARRKLRAADEARTRHGTSSGKPGIRADSSLHRHSVSAIRHTEALYNKPPPDSVSKPHDYLRSMSSDMRPGPGELRVETSFDQPVSDDSTTNPLSPLVFSDVDFETGSSCSRNSVSPTEAPTEAPTSATTATGDGLGASDDSGASHDGGSTQRT